MRYLGLITISAAILSFGITLGAASQPAEAGQACDAAGLPSPCAGSSDIKPNIKLGTPGDDGDFQVKTSAGATGVKLDGKSGSMTNRFSNKASKSNGLVKAWAQIAADGSVVACWRCNKNTAETNMIITGVYEVDFTPVSGDITGRPRLATIDDHANGNAQTSVIDVADRIGDASSIFVDTRDINGTALDSPFTLLLF